MVSLADIKEKLQEVKDPEIPTISVLELGVITKIEQPDSKTVHIEMTPTFVGCPAIDFMKLKVKKAVEQLDLDEVQVVVNYDKSWSSNLITEEGKKKLKEFGISPPKQHNGDIEFKDLEEAACPHCNSHRTSLNSPFGPTLCRAIHVCYDCGEVFEQFKPV